MPLPDFSSPTLFPSFADVPLEASPPPITAASAAVVPYPPNNAAPSSSLPPPYSAPPAGEEPAPPPPPSYSPTPETTTHFLLAQVKQNMTITKPTLIATDASGVDFAITFEDRGIDLRPVKMGWTVVIPGATRTAPPADGSKKGFVRVPEGRGTGVHYIPAKLARVMEVGRRLNEAEGTVEEDEEDKGCMTCGREGGETGGALLKCTGCVRVTYCGKDCQRKDWTEGGHKSDCKVFKAMAVTWGV
ncbi:hypothetical protein B0T11DRAFT_283282 [Plectosphaerella cucumerina]|uniref:MYND-type domain-containing protein n=1 Tax=Plectosphaerella cucumerina TaxID=40658 RepID=A0A8K0TA89_9PEZI|nr:hypothetical protein B0T11DRAFT_283282 [Plectosphaerella cucumerina]